MVKILLPLSLTQSRLMGVQENRKQKEEMILEVAEKIFSKRGFENTKVDDIAAELGMSKGTVYFYFESKEDIYLALTYRAMQSLLDYFYLTFDKIRQENGYDIIYQLAETYLDFTEKYPFYFDLIQNYTSMVRQEVENIHPNYTKSIYFRKLADLHNIPFKIFCEEIEKGQNDRSITSHKAAALMYLALWSVISGYADLRYHTISTSRETFYGVKTKEWREMTMQIVDYILTDS